MPRMFVAAWPTVAVTDRLHELPRPDESGVRWVPPANWHVTLRFLGEVDADEAVALLRTAELPAATARLGPAVDRLGRALIVVPVDGVDALAEAVVDATASIGEAPSHRFRGHLTLARTGDRAPSSVVGTPISQEFGVDEVVLVRSDTDRRGSTYTTVARFPTR